MESQATAAPLPSVFIAGILNDAEESVHAEPRFGVRQLVRWLVLGIACFAVNANAAENASEHEHHANDIALFFGLAHEGRHDGPALGLEYERRLSPVLGIGVLAERTWGDFDFWVYAIPITLHADRWKFIVAPGIEESGGHTEKLLRFTVGYELQGSEIKVTPSISVDFVDDESVYVFGIAFGMGF
jgi:hypothetical protein